MLERSPDLERSHHITLLDRVRRNVSDDAIAQLSAPNGEEISMPEFDSKQMNPFKTAKKRLNMPCKHMLPK